MQCATSPFTSRDQSTQNHPHRGYIALVFLNGHSQCDDRIYIFTNSPEYNLVCMIVVSSRDTDLHGKKVGRGPSPSIEGLGLF